MTDTTYLDDTELFARSARAIEALTNELTRLRDEHAKLLGFVRDAVRYVAIGMDPNTLHEKACEHGIIIADSPDGPCSEQCACALRGFFPTTCYRLAEFVRAQ